MDKMREEFEEWAKSEGFSVAKGMTKGSAYVIYADGETYSLWEAWQASRKALVVTLPGKISQQNIVNGRVIPEAENYDEAIEDCADAIREAGINVKGEGDEQTNVLSD